MDQSTDTGFFRHNKGLELGFMIIGIALFIVLGLRGLQRIGDMRVAAGERNRASSVQTTAELQAPEAPGESAAISTLSLHEPAKDDDKAQKSNGRDKAEPDKVRAEPKNDDIINTVENVKKQNI